MWTAPASATLTYSHVINQCLVSEEVFDGFKRNSVYNSIVGMASDWQAEVWYNNIKENFPSIFNRLEEFKHNDTVGDPEVWDSKESGLISSSTLRYLHTVCDIKTHFGSMNDKNVVEIGVGYGGLCYMLHTYYKLRNYHLVDLDNAILLVRKYLKRLGMHKSISFETEHIHPDMPADCTLHTKIHGNNEDLLLHKKNGFAPTSDEVAGRGGIGTGDYGVEYDLAISEFCLSEMDDDGIDEYYNKYLVASKQIYLMMNLHDETRKKKCINKIEKDFDIEILDEFPVTDWPNYIIVGNKK